MPRCLLRPPARDIRLPVFRMVNRDKRPERYQLFVYEDRSRWPPPECPLRLAMEGEKHIDMVPVCYA